MPPSNYTSKKPSHDSSTTRAPSPPTATIHSEISMTQSTSAKALSMQTAATENAREELDEMETLNLEDRSTESSSPTTTGAASPSKPALSLTTATAPPPPPSTTLPGTTTPLTPITPVPTFASTLWVTEAFTIPQSSPFPHSSPSPHPSPAPTHTTSSTTTPNPYLPEPSPSQLHLIFAALTNADKLRRGARARKFDARAFVSALESVDTSALEEAERRCPFCWGSMGGGDYEVGEGDGEGVEGAEKEEDKEEGKGKGDGEDDKGKGVEEEEKEGGVPQAAEKGIEDEILEVVALKKKKRGGDVGNRRHIDQDRGVESRHDAVKLGCGHLFGYGCLVQILESGERSCPKCRREVVV